MKDLVILAADRDIEFTLKGLLGRPAAMEIRPPTFDVFVHPDHDPGCLLDSQNLLRSRLRAYQHALVVFDRIGSGGEIQPREVLERQVEDALVANGWDGRCCAVAIDPEVESWVWSRSAVLDQVVGWDGPGDMRDWLFGKELLATRDSKPGQPKETLQIVLRHTRVARSSSIYYQLAQQVSLKNCQDLAFAKLGATLRDWYPPGPAGPVIARQV